MPISCHCQYCGKQFFVKPSKAQKGYGKYCSGLCRNAVQKIPLHDPSFWNKVNICQHGFSCPYCCWEWTGPLQIDGYGDLKRTRERGIAHRIAWEIWHKIRMPSGLLCCHYCHHRKCCNPSHLHPGTRQDNSDDSTSIFRFTHGQKHWWSKLTESDIPQIFLMREQGISVINIAKHFHVSWRNIYVILRRDTWRHLP